MTRWVRSYDVSVQVFKASTHNFITRKLSMLTPPLSEKLWHFIIQFPFKTLLTHFSISVTMNEKIPHIRGGKKSILPSARELKLKTEIKIVRAFLAIALHHTQFRFFCIFAPVRIYDLCRLNRKKLLSPGPSNGETRFPRLESATLTRSFSFSHTKNMKCSREWEKHSFIVMRSWKSISQEEERGNENENKFNLRIMFADSEERRWIK